MVISTLTVFLCQFFCFDYIWEKNIKVRYKSDKKKLNINELVYLTICKCIALVLTYETFSVIYEHNIWAQC